MNAAEDGNTENVKILLKHGADVNTKNNGGYLSNIIFIYQFISPSIHLSNRICVYLY